MRLVTIAAASVSPKVCDFNRNFDALREIIEKAEESKVHILVTPEMGMTGYSLGDRVLWNDVVDESMSRIGLLTACVPPGMTAFVGGPIIADDKLYNAMFCLNHMRINGAILKRNLPTYNVFYEGRNWAAWDMGTTKLDEVTIGNVIFQNNKYKISGEICEDLWSTNTIIPELVANGAEIIINGSASPFTPGKVKLRESLITATAMKNNCVYVYANLVGLEDRLVFDGDCYIATPDGIVAKDNMFLRDTPYHMITATVDLDDVRQSRLENSTWRANSAKVTAKIDKVQIEDSQKPADIHDFVKTMKDSAEHIQYSKINQALSLGLKDYFEKNGCFRKIIIALSGGRDSALCLKLAHDACRMMRRDPKDVIITFYLSHKRNSGLATRRAARSLARECGVPFYVHDITYQCDMMERAVLVNQDYKALDRITKQNIQARVRGSYTLNVANEQNGLVLVTSNMSEAAVGYCTTGGDNQGGLSLIADIPKTMVNTLLSWTGGRSKAIERIKALPASAELEPGQKDETDLMPYVFLDDLLGQFAAKKRSIADCYRILCCKYEDKYSRDDMYRWCKSFITRIASNQWKRDQHPVGIRVLSLDLDPKAGFRFPIIQSIATDLAELEIVHDNKLTA